jgi:hypothetical protein
MKRAKALLALLAVLAIPATAASAADEKQQCLNASDQGQQLRDDGKYRRAREAFTTCSRDVCPAIVRRDCVKWLAEVEQSWPSIVVGAKDDKGSDLVDVNVLVDNVSIASHLDGKPIPVDPGEHTLRFETSGFPALEQKVVVHAGEKSRLVAVQFGSPPSTSSTTGPSNGSTTEAPHGGGGSRASAWVFAGIAAAAFGAEAYFGLSGLSDRNNLKQTCGTTSTCSQSSVDSIKTKFTIADIALGVGVVSTAISVYLFVAPQASQAPAASSAAFDVAPVPGGAEMTVGGRF